jgi:hypothetical protein
MLQSHWFGMTWFPATEIWHVETKDNSYGCLLFLKYLSCVTTKTRHLVSNSEIQLSDINLIVHFDKETY